MSRDINRINCDHHYRRSPQNNNGNSSSTVERGLSKDVVKKINEIDQGSSTLTSSGIQGFSARIVEKKHFPQSNSDRRPSLICYNLLTIEIIKKPGQTLGLYLREGDGDDRSDGVFVSRMADDGELKKCDVLNKGDEILSVNHVDVSRTCLDDVVIMMSITKRLLLQVVRKESKEKSLKTSPVVVASEKNLNDDNLTVRRRNKQLLRSDATDLESKYLRNNRKRVPDGWRSSAPIIVEQKNFHVQEYYPGGSFPSLEPLPYNNGGANNNNDYGTETLSASAETVRNLKQSHASSSLNILTKSNSLPKQNVPLIRTNRWKRSFDVDKNEMNYYNGSAPELPTFALHRYPRDLYPDDMQMDYHRYPIRTSLHYGSKYSHHSHHHLGPSPKTYDLHRETIERHFESDKKFIPSLTGVLVLHVIEGRGMHISDNNDNTNEEMYCVVQIDGDHRARTEVSSRSSGFKWNEVFEIDVCDCKQADFFIYSWHPLHRRTLRHRGRLRLPEALITGRLKDQEHCFALCLEPKGQLLISVGYHSVLYAYRRLSSNRRNAYWGVPLSSLVFRESDAGYGSPILFKRMIDEVERRGIDVLPGLYSMCASLEKKLNLKHQLEIQPSAACLDSESVPDPNLITTLIKDFLRELPEPLVPSCTYQLLVDAWRVLLPDNKEGNAKLMLDVLDCLPSEHKSTFIVLMDHLKYVLSHAPNNGLSIEKLSRIFGPLMFCTCRPIETKNLKRIPINYLDYNLAGFVFEVMIDLWPYGSNTDKSYNGTGRWSADSGADLESYC